MTRKWLAFVLAIAMLLTMMPMGLAEDVLESDAIEEIVEEPVEIVEEPAEDEEIVEADGTYIMTIDSTYFTVQQGKTATANVNFPEIGKILVEPVDSTINFVSAWKLDDAAVSGETTTKKGDQKLSFTLKDAAAGVCKYNIYYQKGTEGINKTTAQKTVITINATASATAITTLEVYDKAGTKYTDATGTIIEKQLPLLVGYPVKVKVVANAPATVDLQFADNSFVSVTKVEISGDGKTTTFEVTGLKAGKVAYRATAVDNTGKSLTTNIATAEVKVAGFNVPVSVTVSPAEISMSTGNVAYMEAVIKGLNAFGEQIILPEDKDLANVSWKVNGTAYTDAEVKKLIEISEVTKGDTCAIKIDAKKAGLYILTATTPNNISAEAAVNVTAAGIEITKIYTNLDETAEADKKNLNIALPKGKSADLSKYLTFWYKDTDGKEKQDTTNTYPVTWSVAEANGVSIASDGKLSIASGSTVTAGNTVVATVKLNSNVAVFATVTVKVLAAADEVVRSMAVYTGTTPTTKNNNVYGLAVANNDDASNRTAPTAGATNVIAALDKTETNAFDNIKYYTESNLGTPIVIAAGKSQKLNAMYSAASRYTYNGTDFYTFNSASTDDFVTMAGLVDQPTTSWQLVRPKDGSFAGTATTLLDISDYASVDQNGVVTIKKVFPNQATDYVLLKVTDTANTYLTCYIQIMSDYSAVAPTEKPYVAMTGFDTDFVLNEKGLAEVGLGETLNGGIVVEPANATGSFKYELKEVTTKKEFADLSQPDGEDKPDLTILGLEVGYPEIWQIKVTQTDGAKVVTKSAYFKMATVEDEPIDYTFDIEDDDVVIDLADDDPTYQLSFAADSDIQDWDDVEWVNAEQFSDYFYIDEDGEIYAYAVTPDDGIAAEAEVALAGAAIKDDVVNVTVIDTTVEPTEEPQPLKFSILEDTVELEPYDDAYLTLDGDIDNWDDVVWTNEDEFEEYFYILDGRIIAIAETPDEGIVAVAECDAAILSDSVDTVTVIVKKAFVPTATPVVIIPTEAPTEKPTEAPIMHQIAYVNGTSVNLRADDSSSSESLAKLRKGTMVEVIEEGDAWAYVYTIEGYGYISNSLLTVPEFGEYSENGYYVTASSLNIRVAPNGDKLPISPLANGVYVTVIGGVVDGWMLVDYMGTEGYVSAQYLSIIA